MNLGQFIKRSAPAIPHLACQLVLTCGGGGAGGGGGGRQQVHGRQRVRRCGPRGGDSACACPRPSGSWRDRRLALWRRLGCARLPISPRYTAATPPPCHDCALRRRTSCPLRSKLHRLPHPPPALPLTCRPVVLCPAASAQKFPTQLGNSLANKARKRCGKHGCPDGYQHRNELRCKSVKRRFLICSCSL